MTKHKQVALALKKLAHCYLLAMYIAKGKQLDAPVEISMKGLTTSNPNYYIAKARYHFKVDSAFHPVRFAKLGCAAQKKVQERKLDIRGNTPQMENLRWKLYEIVLDVAAGNRALCNQCSASQCGKISQNACRPLLSCLQSRDVSLSQCKKAIWFRKN